MRITTIEDAEGEEAVGRIMKERAEQVAGITAERDAARGEVARLTEALRGASRILTRLHQVASDLHELSRKLAPCTGTSCPGCRAGRLEADLLGAIREAELAL